MDYINLMESLNLNIASEYLVMASELVEMKSKMLLPKKQVIDTDLLEDIDSTCEELVVLSNEEVAEAVRLVTKEKGYDINTIDGVRATFNDGWALVRCSNTGPNITVRFEAETQERLEEIQKEFLSKIEEYNKE